MGGSCSAGLSFCVSVFVARASRPRMCGWARRFLKRCRGCGGSVVYTSGGYSRDCEGGTPSPRKESRMDTDFVNVYAMRWTRWRGGSCSAGLSFCVSVLVARASRPRMCGWARRFLKRCRGCGGSVVYTSGGYSRDCEGGTPSPRKAVADGQGFLGCLYNEMDKMDGGSCPSRCGNVFRGGPRKKSLRQARCDSFRQLLR